MAENKGNKSGGHKGIAKDSGRGLPMTNTSTPMPPTKPPASKSNKKG